jgi:hypothetical protein
MIKFEGQIVMHRVTSCLFLIVLHLLYREPIFRIAGERVGVIVFPARIFLGMLSRFGPLSDFAMLTGP